MESCNSEEIFETVELRTEMGTTLCYIHNSGDGLSFHIELGELNFTFGSLLEAFSFVSRHVILM